MSIGSGHSHSSDKRAEIRKLLKEIQRDVRGMREESAAGGFKEMREECKELTEEFEKLTEVVGK